MLTAFEPVRRAAAGLPQVEESTSYGTPALRVRGRGFARLREDGDSLVLRTDFDSRDAMLQAQPGVFYLTDHYRDHPYVLVRLSAVRPAQLRELLADAWRLMAPKTLSAGKPLPRASRQDRPVRCRESLKPESPARQLEGFIARFDPAIARLARAARSILRRRLPTAVELVYDNYNALAVGWGATDRASDVILGLAIYARGINLYFMHGARLPDPDGVLQGKGSRGRFIRLEKAATLDTPAVVALFRAAIRQARTPLPASGRGRTVIKPVSTKQRPRRPPAG